MTAVVVSFPQERIFRNRSGQVEARKAYQVVRRRSPTLVPSDVWERTLSALTLAARTSASGERERSPSYPNEHEDRMHPNRQAKADRLLAAHRVMERLEAALTRLDRIEKEKRLLARLGIDAPPPSAA